MNSRFNYDGSKKQPTGDNVRPQDPKYLKYGDPEELEAKFKRDAGVMMQRKAQKLVNSFTGYHEFLSLEQPC